MGSGTQQSRSSTPDAQGHLPCPASSKSPSTKKATTVRIRGVVCTQNAATATTSSRTEALCRPVPDCNMVGSNPVSSKKGMPTLPMHGSGGQHRRKNGDRLQNRSGTGALGHATDERILNVPNPKALFQLRPSCSTIGYGMVRPQCERGHLQDSSDGSPPDAQTGQDGDASLSSIDSNPQVQ